MIAESPFMVVWPTGRPISLSPGFARLATCGPLSGVDMTSRPSLMHPPAARLPGINRN